MLESELKTGIKAKPESEPGTEAGSKLGAESESKRREPGRKNQIDLEPNRNSIER